MTAPPTEDAQTEAAYLPQRSAAPVIDSVVGNHSRVRRTNTRVDSDHLRSNHRSGVSSPAQEWVGTRF